MEKQYKIIIIEDENIWQNILLETLKDQPFKIMIFTDYESAEIALRDQLFHFAIVDLRLLMDFHKDTTMNEDWDGWKVLDMINKKSLNTTMGTLVLTWHDSKHFKERVTKEFGYLFFKSKREFDGKDLVSTIQHYFKYHGTDFNKEPLKK
jgi:DNA-binding response OmpR family regulator